ncbi:MAG: ArsR/SmtB family transcription factor [Demequina sp.]
MSLEDLEDSIERRVVLDETLGALANPVRRFLLELLIDGEATAGELAASAAANFGISAKRGSQHLQVLAQAGLVDVLPAGTWRSYRLKPGGGDEVIEWLARLD